MNNSIIIKDLSKVYHLYDKPTDMVKEAIHPFRKTYHHDFVATKTMNLEIFRGETVGIIGKNGAGKSTLLKMITGVLTPTKGSIEIHGKIASLLELGAGFNPEMTGMENIYLNGTIMGFSKEEMDTKIEAILNFADIGEFIYQPVKMYSSGMFARLAFSVSINVDPDILIVDEALSVGDMAFQMKCFKKFQEFQEKGKTILFVTHSLDTVIRYCTRGIIIDQGEIVYDGMPKTAVDNFKKVLSGNFYNKDEQDTQALVEENIKLKDTFQQHHEMDVYGNGKAEIIDYAILDTMEKPSVVVDYNSEFFIILKVKFYTQITNPIFAFTIKDHKGLEITGTNTLMKHFTVEETAENQVLTIKFKQNANLQMGKYALSLGCVTINHDGVEVLNRIYDAILFEVIGAQQMVGFFDLQSEIVIETA